MSIEFVLEVNIKKTLNQNAPQCLQVAVHYFVQTFDVDFINRITK